MSLSLEELCSKIKQLPKRQLWRYGQAGDLPGEGENICIDALNRLVAANRRRPVLAFTHKPATPANVSALRDAQSRGFVVNLSADNVQQADELAETDLPVVVVLPSAYARQKDESLGDYRQRRASLPKRTPAGRKIAVCPATYVDVTCDRCRICSNADRKGVVIGFPAHGSRRRDIDNRLSEGP